MFNDFGLESQHASSPEPTPILFQKVVDKCHVLLPDTPRPTSAIIFEDQFYVFVKFFPTVEAARRGAQRMTDRGNTVVLTRIPKGLVLWVLEPEAQPVGTSSIQ
ncbi:hypothetical protein H6F88_31060 [Oculatella sp. FACHB-28]|uniref:hypothetical protein n=1 Tax=Cyanophyceae TaxID=3028117 RepID=UPI0016838380|nr:MULTISPECIES: hypothetical protein [Cyanophyceae]MBD1996316.1 hypothetical protein [Leptolyngbya sp. FACHB-541]MBD2060385.1 hypothetical protein [Oculatella sp. FACHB-28]MBD2067027.1 hypothetical protein [Leptolyngbya sp. FACHB-671]